MSLKLIKKKRNNVIGAPISISMKIQLKFLIQINQLFSTYHGANIDEISSYVGCSLDALIGNNILKNYTFRIDFENKLFSVWNSTPEEIINSENSIKADFQGIPTIDILINDGSTITSWLDTGAKISYINKDCVQHLSPSDNKRDFFPSYGEFEVPIYDIPIIFNGVKIPFKFGVFIQAH